MSGDDLSIRRAVAADRPAIIDVCRQSLGWKPDDPSESFFAWKHDENSFGPSPMWVATTPGGDIIGVRAFMTWRFRDPSGKILHGVRAVDTATTPKAQGKGVFKRLTLGALPDLRNDGVDFVFNTPNDKSRPGYLKMGWNTVGRVPVAVGIRDMAAVRRLAGARTAAEMWSETTEFAEPAAAVLRDGSQCAELLSRTVPPNSIATDLDAAYLGWRYAFPPLRYRLLRLGDTLSSGAVIFRVRKRGSAVEVAVCDVIGPPDLRPARALRAILHGTGADYLIIGAHRALSRSFCVPIGNLGPQLTWRAIGRTGTPKMSDLRLSVGDVELF